MLAVLLEGELAFGLELVKVVMLAVLLEGELAFGLELVMAVMSAMGWEEIPATEWDLVKVVMLVLALVVLLVETWEAVLDASLAGKWEVELAVELEQGMELVMVLWATASVEVKALWLDEA
jgi:hypothetical protein